MKRIVMLSMLLVITVSVTAAGSEVYYNPQEGSAEFCDNESVEIWANATGFQGGQINLTYDSSCANVTGWERNTTNFLIGGWSHYDGREWITFSTMDPQPVLLIGNYMIGTLTIHCVSEEGCESPLAFIEPSKLLDDRGYPVSANWTDGTFRCKKECEGTDTSCGIYPNCENCTEKDGCYLYDNGCEERDYYCESNEEGCNYTYTNRYTDYYEDWVFYCKDDVVWKHRLFHNFSCDGGSCIDHTSWVDEQLLENCNDHDGWYCKGDLKADIREYRDYNCSEGRCTYTIISSENCNDLDGCYAYEDGCEDRDYYCSGGACVYIHSNRHTDYYDDWIKYCKGDEVWKNRLYHNFSCDGGSCTDHTSWVNDQMVENCSCQCTANNTVKKCNGGNCTDTGICNSSLCGADVACDGKKPGESCGAGRICNSTCRCVRLAPPEIIFYAPESPVNDSQGATRTFNISINQTVNVSWQINGTVVQTDKSVTEASYTNTSAAIGTWNVSAVVNNTNGTDMQTWVWNVHVPTTVNETEYLNMIPQPVNVSKIRYKFKAVDDEWAAKWTTVLLYGQKKTKYSIELHLNKTGYVTRVDFRRWGFPITEIPYELAVRSLDKLG